MDPDALRSALLALHKALLAAERQNLERVHGPVSNAEYLQIVQDPLRYGWLKPFTELILAFDDDEEERASPEELADARGSCWRRRSRRRRSAGGTSHSCSGSRRS